MSNELAIINYLKRYIDSKGLGGIGGLEYKECNLETTLTAGQTLIIPLEINSKAMIINTLYFSGEDYFDFRIFDSLVSGFKLYETKRIQEFSDTIFLPYQNKDGTNNIILELQNHGDSTNKINIKILGMKIKEAV